MSKLYIENFRSIKGPFVLNFSQINALVGQNNTGKSNVLLAIQKVLGPAWVTVNTFDEQDVYYHNSGLDIKIALEFDPPLKYQKIKEAEPTEIKILEFNYTHYKQGIQRGQRRLDKTCLNAKGESPLVLAKAPKKGEQHRFEPLIGIPQDVSESIPLIYIGARRELKDQLPYARFSLLGRLLEDVDKCFHQDSSRDTKFRELMNGVINLLRTDEFISLEKSIKENALQQLGFDPTKDADKLDFFFSPFTTIDFYKSLKLLVREGKFEIDATELGGGIQNALVISILKAFEERRKQGAIFLIEEPEMYLHPQMQRSLYKTLREIGKTNQIIYTTHSPHFVTIPEYNEVIIITKDEHGTDKKVSNIIIDEIRREKIRKEFDPERNELFFAKRLLLVEGDTEKLSLPEYASKMNVDLDNAGVTIIEVGGKKSLLEFAKIAISFEMQTGVVYDEDSHAFPEAQKEQEKQYNKNLDALKKNDGSVMVWKFNKKYEDELRNSLGDEAYQRLCQKYPNHSNAIRQRLIAADPQSKVPDFILPIINWVAQK